MNVMHISKSFRVADKWFFGPVVATDAAILMVINKIRGRAATGSSTAAFAFGGALTTVMPITGMTFLGNYDGNTQIPPNLFSIELGQIPIELSSHPRWPASLRKRPERQTIVILKQNVSKIKKSLWSGLTFAVGGEEIRMELNFLDYTRIGRFLQANKWNDQ